MSNHDFYRKGYKDSINLQFEAYGGYSSHADHGGKLFAELAPDVGNFGDQVQHEVLSSSGSESSSDYNKPNLDHGM